MGWTTGVRFLAEAGNFSQPHPGRFCQLAVKWLSGFLEPGVKRPGLEADHSPSSCAQVKNAWSCKSTVPYVFMAWYLIRPRDNVTSYLMALACTYCFIGFAKWCGVV
jgi:hypothetical protein